MTAKSEAQMKDGAMTYMPSRALTPRRSQAGHPPLSFAEELDLAQRWIKNKDIAARNRIILAYQPLCMSIARQMAPRHLFNDDIVQEGVVGLMHALDKFDPALGFRFGTYARWWVRASISDALKTTEAGKAGLTGETVKMRRSYDVTRRVALAALRKNGAEPELGALRQEIAERMGVGLRLIEQFEASRAYISLNLPIGKEDGRNVELIEVIPEDALGAEDRLDRDRRDRLQGRVIADLFEKLTPREIEVLDRRFGRNREKETLQEIAESLGVSRERIRQIEEKALAKLRTAGSRHRDRTAVTETLTLEDVG